MPIMKMKISSAYITILSLLLMFPVPLYHPEAALADPAKMSWSIVDTPAQNQADNTIVSLSEVNAFVVANDDLTLYAIDIPNRRIYKSQDNGASWPAYNELGPNLIADGANFPVWDIALAPDDPSLVVVVTDGTGAPNGPKRAFISINGGTTWYNSNLTIAAGEFVSALDISSGYGGQGRDIAIGTRNGTGTGRVLVLKLDNFAAGWQDQSLSPVGDVVALKFSPNYTSDATLVVAYADSPAAIGGTFLITGSHDLANNTTTWGSAYEIKPSGVPAGSSPDATEIITADLELPANFVGTNAATRRYYFCNDDAILTGNAGVYRIDDTQSYFINPPVTARFSSIAYWGTWEGGKLVAGEVTTDPTSPFVNVWRCIDPISNAPNWLRSHDQKSPTGGANSGYANAQLAWNPAGNRLYCSTGSADLLTGGTVWLAGRWPFALLTTVALDESAFSISPYTRYYEFDRVQANRTLDSDIGLIWNQTGLIDTELSFLSDVEALEAQDIDDYPLRYLASISDNTDVTWNFDSVWRSTTDQIDRTWERILCVATGSDSMLLRINPRVEDELRSQVLACAEPATKNVRFSTDEGQNWQVLYPNINVVDVTLGSDKVMFVLGGTYVRRGEATDVLWTWGSEVSTTLGSNHTIATPLKNREYPDKPGEYEDWIVVGDQINGYIVYADFSKPGFAFNPPPLQRIAVPVPGNMHVIFDDKFEETRIVYAASNDFATNTLGKIYRWTAGESADWDELEPPNNAFYGLAQGNDVLYGIWNEPVIPGTLPGADRTLYPRAPIPPPIEWDDLTEGLPNTVRFTREPTALKLSVSEYNTLWAIDDRDYDPVNSIGCLWAYTDTMSTVGPWSTAPPSGELIPVDPVSGRATEVNFVWEQVEYATGYELQIAKDEEFTIQVLSSDNITPVDQMAPAVYFPAGGLSPTPASAVGAWGNLESGHDYYWRVRASRAVTGEVVRSPWSATMFFTVKAGLATIAKDIGLTLLKPSNGERNVTLSPSFSWAPLPKTSAYEIIIAEDPALEKYIAKATVSGTAYEFDDILEPNRVYFWQVRAVKPSPSEPSPVANFTTIITDEKPEETTPQKTKLPFWIWPVIAVYGLLIIAMIVFAYMRPSLFEPASKRAGKPAPRKPLSKTSEFVGRPAPGRPFKPPAESVIELPPSQPVRPTTEYTGEPTPIQPQEHFVTPPPGQPDEPSQEQFTEQYQFVEQPKPAGEPHPIIDKVKSPFIRIAESFSPKYRQRRYLEELEEKGIIEPMQHTIEETPREGYTTRLKNSLKERFRKKSSPEDEGYLE